MSQSPAPPPERTLKTLKAVLVGESTVGKTSILAVANTGHFDRGAAPTIGACFVANNYTFPDRSVRLNVWDTAGQERYRALAPMYYREMDIGCLVYAIDSRPSFDAIETWYAGSLRELPNRPQFYLIGNKRDLAEFRVVTEQMGAELARMKDQEATFAGLDRAEAAAAESRNALEAEAFALDRALQGELRPFLAGKSSTARARRSRPCRCSSRTRRARRGRQRSTRRAGRQSASCSNPRGSAGTRSP
jgi:small GTP-binding protein